MPNKEEQLKRSLIQAALEGGSILKKYFRSEKVDVKVKLSPGDLVTNVDFMVQDTVSRVLEAAFPKVMIVGEEDSKENTDESEEVIYLDPLDGTLNYIHGFNQFAISIGYWRGDEPLAGVVFNPILDDLFFAFTGKGAFRNEKPIHVSNNSSLENSLLATGWPYSKKENSSVVNCFSSFLEISQEVRAIGSAALAMCYVASGIMDGYWEWGLYPWDLAGGVVIALEAGSRVTSLDGDRFTLKSGAIVASNGSVHKRMISVLQKNKLLGGIKCKVN